MSKLALQLFVLLVTAPGCISPALAQRVQDSAILTSTSHSIVAVVNSDIITNHDLLARIKLALLSSGMPSNAETIDKLAPQILRGLIDEKLQHQEAKRLDISVPETDIAEALQKIATDNRIPGGNMRTFLSSNGIPVKTLTDQIESTLGWTKVIQRTLRPKVQVADDEVDAAVERMGDLGGTREYLVSEIYLSLDDGKDEGAIRKLADHLVAQIKTGAPFAAIARQFSQNGGAASGGDIGWVRQGQLTSEINTALSGAQRGQVIGPVRSSSGYHIFGIRDVHMVDAKNGETRFRVIQAITSRKDTDTTAQADKMRTSFNGCTTIDEIKKLFPQWKWLPEETVPLSQAPSWLSGQLFPLKAGEASTPTPTSKGLMMMFVCDKTQTRADVDRNAIMNAIGTEKLELQARSLLRNLRRTAYLDIRLHTIAQ